MPAALLPAPRYGSSLLDHWPNRCAVCGGASRGREQRICTPCMQRLAASRWRCRRCAMPLPAAATSVPCGACLRAPPPWSLAVAALDYAYPWDAQVAALKFRAGLDLLPWAARTLNAALDASLQAPIGLVLPVPLAPARLRERGYNQAWELARRVAALRGLPASNDLLERVIDTPHQLSLPRERRGANLRGAFALTASGRARLRGARIALVDDVLTTGATLSEATRTLLAGGTSEVQVWVLARTA